MPHYPLFGGVSFQNSEDFKLLKAKLSNYIWFHGIYFQIFLPQKKKKKGKSLPILFNQCPFFKKRHVTVYGCLLQIFYTCRAKCQEGTIKFVLQLYITLSLLSKLNNGFSMQLTIQKVPAISHEDKVGVRSIINDNVMEKGQEITLGKKRKEN